ncbi:peptidoglycan-binding protein [Couchioplanes azureus]|uniref:peptidoglycan-binding protein n=1 Tax=Couchioplanes caeruleus TaxID=56438 RepID=UPI00167162A9|nr:peptidoglycan-binding protein [Couchioplanes caeruleus]GGQ76925.1 peptidoglycan-binding protein [Couchioplanes caeruleus subsp. azureus]
MNQHAPRTGRSRRWLLSRGTAVGIAATVTGMLVAGEASALPAVDMEMVLLAAQVDPPKDGTGATDGAAAHVREVERALNAKGLLAASAVDGHYGTSTRSAYAAWQRSLGFSGIDANGLPGATSLAKLGDGRFTVTRAVSAGSSTTYGGRKVNARTRDMLAAADARLTWNLALDQGSYSTSDPTSAGTHDGGGAVDITVANLTTTQRWQTVRALRTVGFAAWWRTPPQGSWPHHIHAVAISDPDLSAPAAQQIHDYYFGRNGLANHAADDTPAAYRTAFTWWEKYRRATA